MLSLLRGPRAFALAAILVLIVGGSALALSGGNTEVKASRAVNCPPHARDDAARAHGTEPAVIDVLANDTDPDGDPLLFNIIDSSDGSVKVDQNATPTDSTDDRISYTPSAGATGVETITYEVEDPKGLTDRARVTIEIGPAAPEAAGEIGPAAAPTGTPAAAAPEATTEPSLDGLVPDRDDDTAALDSRCGRRPRATKATTTTEAVTDDTEVTEDTEVESIDEDDEGEGDDDSTTATKRKAAERRTGGTTTTTRRSSSGSTPTSGNTGGGNTGGGSDPGTGGDPSPTPDPDPAPDPEPDPGDDGDSPSCGQPGQPSCRDYACSRSPYACSTTTTQPDDD